MPSPKRFRDTGPRLRPAARSSNCGRAARGSYERSGGRVNPELETSLRAAGLDTIEVANLVDLAFDEDLRYGPDVTTEATIGADQLAQADVVAREAGVVCGVDVARVVLDAAGFAMDGVTVLLRDG